MADRPEMMELTEDAVLSGRLKLRQSGRGHRAGTDAVLLLAAAGTAGRVVDLGAGVGTAGLGLAVLGRAGHVRLVERDTDCAGLARQNIRLNDLEARAEVIEIDLTAPARTLAGAGLPAGSADLVIANPPYNEPGRHRASPLASRAAAHEMGPEAFDAWTRTAARLLAGQGRFVMIHRPGALPWLLPVLARRFGAITILPVHSAADAAATRVLISARLNSKTPARLLPALVLHQPDGRFTAYAAALHAGEQPLPM